jgi:hypothetical protein
MPQSRTIVLSEQVQVKIDWSTRDCINNEWVDDAGHWTLQVELWVNDRKTQFHNGKAEVLQDRSEEYYLAVEEGTLERVLKDFYEHAEIIFSVLAVPALKVFWNHTITPQTRASLVLSEYSFIVD